MQIIKPDTQHIMLDLETMGNNSNAVITEIGAVLFDNNAVISKFSTLVDIDSCLANGMEVTGGTIAWWLDQQTKAGAQPFAKKRHHVDLALADFIDWIHKNTSESDNVQVWGNGASFDQPILTNALRKCMYTVPWRFWNDRCYRTVKNQFPEIKMERIGKHHRGVDDAESQALHLIEISKYADAINATVEYNNELNTVSPADAN